MSALVPRKDAGAVPVMAGRADPASPAEIDGSCRWPVVFLVLSAVFWLVAAGGLALVAAIELHVPDFPGNISWLTYGRVQAAAGQAFVFGFASLAGLGAGAWLTARLSGTPLAGGSGLVLGGAAWNVGVALGVLGILSGQSTGIEGFEMPASSAVILLAAYLVMASGGVLTLARRRVREVSMVHAYVLGALLCFPWVFLATEVMAVWAPLRGVLQAAAGAWGWQSLLWLWLGFLSLAVLYDLLPDAAAASGSYRVLAVFGFWALALVSGFTGIGRYHGGPFPAWMRHWSGAAEVLMALPVAAVAVTLWPVMRRPLGARASPPESRFAATALVAWVAVGCVSLIGALGVGRQATQFTLLASAMDQVYLRGFIGMALSGAVYSVASRLLGQEWPGPRWVRLHWMLALAAVGLWGTVDAAAGIIQGNLLNDPGVAFPDVARRLRPFLWTGTLAHALYWAGSLVLAANLVWLLARAIRVRMRPVAREWLEPVIREGRA